MDDFTIIRLHAGSTHRESAPCAVAIGNFDGVHQGHRAVLATMAEHARAHGQIPSVLTFLPHPRYYCTANRSLLAAALPRPLAKPARSRRAAYLYRQVQRRPCQHGRAGLCETMLFGMRCQVGLYGREFCVHAARSGNIATLQALGAQAGVHAGAARGNGRRPCMFLDRYSPCVRTSRCGARRSHAGAALYHFGPRDSRRWARPHHWRAHGQYHAAYSPNVACAWRVCRRCNWPMVRCRQA